MDLGMILFFSVGRLNHKMVLMTTLFPPHITRLETVMFSRDAAELAGRIGPRTRVHVWQEGVRIELPLSPGAELGARLVAAGVDVELWTAPLFFGRKGMPATALENIYGPGGTVFLCLNGPSFDEETQQLLARRPGVATFCVNNGAHGFRPDLWACVDAPERFMDSIWMDRTVMKFVPEERMGELTPSSIAVSQCPRVYFFARNDRFNAATFLTEETINWGNHKDRGGGRSVMLVALRIAYELGFRRVVLLGCDFHMSETQRYWFAEQRTTRAIRNNLTSYEILTGFFQQLLPVFEAAGFAVVNATPGSRLTVFPLVDLESELAGAAVDVRASTEGMYRAGRALDD
jgi:hypothetical protein